MPVLDHLPFTLSVTQLLRRMEGREGRANLVEDAEKAIATIGELAQPRAAYAWVDVQEVGETSARVGDGVQLALGPHADLLAPARRACAYVVTLGGTVEERVDQLFAEGDVVAGYLLDSAAIMALGLAGDNMRTLVEAEAEEQGWGVGVRLAPGSLVGWPLREQHKLLELLPVDEIGVTITKNHLMVPNKSFSGLVGIGPTYTTHQVGSACHLCQLRDTCWRARP
jgi:hypothetical protein